MSDQGVCVTESFDLKICGWCHHISLQQCIFMQLDAFLAVVALRKSKNKHQPLKNFFEVVPQHNTLFTETKIPFA